MATYTTYTEDETGLSRQQVGRSSVGIDVMALDKYRARGATVTRTVDRKEHGHHPARQAKPTAERES
jgi:hypothetical protein